MSRCGVIKWHGEDELQCGSKARPMSDSVAKSLALENVGQMSAGLREESESLAF